MRSPFSSSKLAFAPIDPLDDGLGEDIAREQSEAGFQQEVDGQTLMDFWAEVGKDVRKDPNWFTFSDD